METSIEKELKVEVRKCKAWAAQGITADSASDNGDYSRNYINIESAVLEFTSCPELIVNI